LRQINGRPLWLGNASDLRNTPQLFSAGIVAVVDLAGNEPPAALPREFVYCRLPIVDGGGNPIWLLRGAIDVVASLIEANVATLVCCSAGMSRSPAILSAALAKVVGSSPAEVLAGVTMGHASDVSPVLWAEILAAIVRDRAK
jgi:protein-tyrosine phosphatase